MYTSNKSKGYRIDKMSNKTKCENL